MEDHLLLQEAAFQFGPIHRIELPLAVLYKHIWEGGLGSSFWAMEKSEIHNFWLLRSKGHISTIAAAELSVFSLLKFVRRLLLHFGRKLRKSYVFALR
jgi:hypothetical protein